MDNHKMGEDYYSEKGSPTKKFLAREVKNNLEIILSGKKQNLKVFFFFLNSIFIFIFKRKIFIIIRYFYFYFFDFTTVFFFMIS